MGIILDLPSPAVNHFQDVRSFSFFFKPHVPWIFRSLLKKKHRTSVGEKEKRAAGTLRPVSDKKRSFLADFTYQIPKSPMPRARSIVSFVLFGRSRIYHSKDLTKNGSPRKTSSIQRSFHVVHWGQARAQIRRRSSFSLSTGCVTRQVSRSFFIFFTSGFRGPLTAPSSKAFDRSSSHARPYCR